MPIQQWASSKAFSLVHGHNLVYNTCWEDPRLDRAALRIGPDDTILVITSAGCNALDYLLDGPRHVYAVDVNPRQNALLELKIAGIRRLDFETFFALFGRGRIASHREIYASLLRPDLSPGAQRFWDRRIGYFDGRGRWPTFYYHGTSGWFARMMNFHIDRVAKIRDGVEAILESATVEAQREIYDTRLRDAFWTRWVRWLLGRDATLSLVGVPRPQRQQVERHFSGGIAEFIEQCVEFVFACLPLCDNYFWRVYLRGEYSRECCPEYLKPGNFERLKDGLVDRLSVHTSTIEQFLDGHDVAISRYVLLDHMDWLSSFLKPALEREWQAIVRRAAPGARLIWRSGGLTVDYVDPIEVETSGGRRRRVGDLLEYHPGLASELHARDRVHTYGSFYIADLATA